MIFKKTRINAFFCYNDLARFNRAVVYFFVGIFHSHEFFQLEFPARYGRFFCIIFLIMYIPKIPAFAQKIINKGLAPRIPRLPDKEIDIYIYRTNQSLETIDTAKPEDIVNIVVQLNQVVKFQPSNQSAEFSLDRSSLDVGGSTFGTNQIAGGIFEEITIDKSQYYFISPTKLEENSLKTADKFRLNRNVPKFRGTEIECGEILGFLENSRSFKALKNAKWSFQEIELNQKVRRISLSFEPTALISANGIQISTSSNQSSGPWTRNSIKQLTTNAYITKIDFGSKNPLNITFNEGQHFGDDTRNAPGRSIIGIAYTNVAPVFDIQTDGARVMKNDAIEINLFNLLGSSNPDLKERYFNQIVTNYEPRWIYHYGAEQVFVSDEPIGEFESRVRRFLNGEYRVGNFVFEEIPEKWDIKGEIKKWRDFNVNEIEDRRGMVLGRFFNHKKFWRVFDNKNLNEIVGEGDGRIIEDDLNFEFMSKNDQKNYVTDSEMYVSLDLSRIEYSPRLNLNVINSNWVKIRVYFEDKVSEQIIYNLSNNQDPTNFRTTIYL